jgi:hypothetical protein
LVSEIQREVYMAQPIIVYRRYDSIRAWCVAMYNHDKIGNHSCKKYLERLECSGVVRVRRLGQNGYRP